MFVLDGNGTISVIIRVWDAVKSQVSRFRGESRWKAERNSDRCWEESALQTKLVQVYTAKSYTRTL
jgi:hypothetical protein